MKKVSPNSPKVKSLQKQDFTPATSGEEDLKSLDMRIALIQALIPLGLDAVAEELQKEVVRLTGEKNSRKGEKTPNRRWGSQGGSVYLSDQKVPISVPRVRDVAKNVEVPLDVYHRLQDPRGMKGFSFGCSKALPRDPMRPVQRLCQKHLGCLPQPFRDDLLRHQQQN